jgi:hypothetical protein
LNCEELSGHYVRFDNTGVANWIDTYDTDTDQIYISINNEWRNATEVTQYKNDKGEWVDAVKVAT